MEHKDRREWVYAREGGVAVSIANYASSSSDAKELLRNLYAAAKKPARAVFNGQVYISPGSRISENFGEDAFAVRIDPAPKLDPSTAPRCIGVPPNEGAVSGTSIMPGT